MKKCKSFLNCEAALCPLDPELKKRIWYDDEKVCRSRHHGLHRWIKKQRSIQKRQTKSWLGRPITFYELYAVSRPRKLSKEHKAGLIKRMALIREKITS